MFAGAAAARAQAVPVPVKPVVGSANPASPEPAVSRPSTTPCVVTLLNNEPFADYSAQPISFAPPAACPGPWAKVVLTVDFTVNRGVQYDRTASFYLGNVNIFFGTTAEPRSNLAPAWHVERDVTDLSAIFKTPKGGNAIVYNIVNSTYTGIIFGTAQLLFYPADLANPAPVVPDEVVPVSGDNNSVALNTAADQVTARVIAPRNVERAYLDVIAQGQQADEFYYFNVPTPLETELASNGNTAFRESEITIDGKPAGVAPVYPWIFTGGIDPFLWEPITGIQTLNFKPYRVDLTPFAALLSDGDAHTVALSVYNANGYFSATANLLLYTDHGRSTTGGELIEDTLTAEPTPQVTENLATNSSGATTGTVTVTSARNFTIRGYVNPSHGRVETRVDQDIHFDNTQTFNVGAAPNYNPDDQSAVQSTTVDSTTTSESGAVVDVTEKHVSYPLAVAYTSATNADGTYTQTTSVDQQYLTDETRSQNSLQKYSGSTSEQVQSTDTLNELANGTYSTAPHSSASYVHKDSAGQCFSRNLTSKDLVLTSVVDGTECAAGSK